MASGLSVPLGSKRTMVGPPSPASLGPPSPASDGPPSLASVEPPSLASFTPPSAAAPPEPPPPWPLGLVLELEHPYARALPVSRPRSTTSPRALVIRISLPLATSRGTRGNIRQHPTPTRAPPVRQCGERRERARRGRRSAPASPPPADADLPRASELVAVAPAELPPVGGALRDLAERHDAGI